MRVVEVSIKVSTKAFRLLLPNEVGSWFYDMIWKDSVYDGLVVNDDIVPLGSRLLGPSKIPQVLKVDCANDGI